MTKLISNTRYIPAKEMEGIRRYAEADKSDPFALARAVAHARSGITKDRPDTFEQSIYDADHAIEVRTLEGVEYNAHVMKNARRP